MSLDSQKIPERPTVLPSRSFWLYVPPPPLFILPVVFGMWLSHRLALPPIPPAVAGFARDAGTVFIVAAGVLILASIVVFIQSRTTVVPHGKARTLLEHGPFRISRNPMYLALVVFALGLTLVLGAPLSFLFLPLPIWIVQTKTIRFEEATLASLFGQRYLDYKSRVRRWL